MKIDKLELKAWIESRIAMLNAEYSKCLEGTYNVTSSRIEAKISVLTDVLNRLDVLSFAPESVYCDMCHTKFVEKDIEFEYVKRYGFCTRCEDVQLNGVKEYDRS